MLGKLTMNSLGNHDEKITSNVWGYSKETFEKKMKLNQILIKKSVKHIFKMFSNSASPTKKSSIKQSHAGHHARTTK